MRLIFLEFKFKDVYLLYMGIGILVLFFILVFVLFIRYFRKLYKLLRK